MVEINLQEDTQPEKPTNSTRSTLDYLKTIPALLKIIEILLSLLGFICIACNYKGTFFVLVCLAAVVVTALLMFLYLFRLSEKFDNLAWHQCEFVFYALWSLLYLIASSLIVQKKSNLLISAAVFGYAATVAYAADAFLKWRAVYGCVIDSGAQANTVRRRNSEESTTSD